MILICLSALACSVLVLLLLMPLAHKFKLLAIPGEHRHHKTSTPLTGGIAIFLSLVIVSNLFSLEIPRALLLAMTLVMIFGVVDDRWTVPFWIRFIVQITAALLLMNDGLVLQDLGHLVSEDLFTLGRWQQALTIFSIVGVINAINMIDGLDGLVGLIIAVALAGLVYLLPATHNLNDIMLCMVVLSGLAGFLYFNLRIWQKEPAKIFMGDAGSMFLGVYLSWFFIKYSQSPVVYFPPVVALWILTIPLFDTVGVMLRRIIRGRSPFHADRLHTHHLLQNFGFGRGGVLVVIIGAAIVFGIFGIVGIQSGVSESTLFFMFMGLFVTYLLGMEIGQYVIQK